MLCGEIVRRVEEAMHDKIVVTPLMWLGNSHHHMDFAGTLSAEPRVYLDLLVGLMENLIAHGFKRILLLNGHGVTMCRASKRCSRCGRITAREPICFCCLQPIGRWARSLGRWPRI